MLSYSELMRRVCYSLEAGDKRSHIIGYAIVRVTDEALRLEIRAQHLAEPRPALLLLGGRH